MIVLRSPEGLDRARAKSKATSWKVSGGLTRCPLPDVKKNPDQLHAAGELDALLQARRVVRRKRQADSRVPRACAPGKRRMSANPHANGGRLKQASSPARLSRLCASKSTSPGVCQAENTRPLGDFLRDVMKMNMTNFRVFGPGRNHLQQARRDLRSQQEILDRGVLPEDVDGGELAADGRVMEMLSEHTMEGMLEGYLLTGRHGFLSTYEAFVHVIDSMFNQHAKWLEICNHLSWREPIASLNLLITSHGLAAGPQRLHPSGSRIPRRGRQQERRTSPASICRPT